ncbi:MAG: caspase family protein, partial [Paracoccaceae bacterium]
MRALSFLAVLLASGPALAEDRALVIGNENYSDAADITAADTAQLAARNLQTAGFTVIEGADLTVADIRARLSQALLEGVEDGRLVILLVGHFAQSGSQTWFLGTDASAPDLVTVGAQGVSLATVLDVAATQAGGAVVLLGTEARRLPLGPGLTSGIGAVDVPQGVTLITGDAARVADFAARSLAARGESLASLLADAPDLMAAGFLSRLVPFRPADPDAPPVVPEG